MNVWQPGNVALGRISKKIYTKIEITRNEEGVYHDFKVLALSDSADNKPESCECYYVQAKTTSLWLPASCIYNLKRPRPFYGPVKSESKVIKKTNRTKKRKIREEHILPLNVHNPIDILNPDLNATYDSTHTPKLEGKYENAFKEFVRRGKEMIFDQFLDLIERDILKKDQSMKYLYIDNVPTEDKFEFIVQNVATMKEIENHLFQCWRYNTIYRVTDGGSGSDNSAPSSPEKLVSVHTSWCVVCGRRDDLNACRTCPAMFHVACSNHWLLSIYHRKNFSAAVTQRTTRTKKAALHQPTEQLTCPSCTWGPPVGYRDIVWHKLGPCPWWPARVLSPGALPGCLLTRKHSAHQWPLQYYGTMNYAWGDIERICLFLPSHTAVLEEKRAEDLRDAIMEASDDYISVYLT